jgi:hypothetical protein
MCQSCFQTVYTGHFADEYEVTGELAKRGILPWSRDLCKRKKTEHELVCAQAPFIYVESSVCSCCFESVYEGYLLDEDEVASQLAKRGLLSWDRNVCDEKNAKHLAVCQGSGPA